MDIQLLKKLVETQSSTTDDSDINRLIEDIVSGIPGVKITKDTFGNIYATKGEGKMGYKTIVSHTDTVHSIKQNRKVFVFEDVMFAMAKGKIQSYDTETVRMTGTGGDDRGGIYTCIMALTEFDDIKAAFFRFEETGCRGSYQANMDFFKDSNFILQCDRKGNSDFITKTNGIKTASEEFDNETKRIYEKFGYSSCVGISTDIGALKKQGVSVSCANISTGYIDPHSDYETINLTDLNNCYNLVRQLFIELGERRFEHNYVAPVYKPATKYGKKGNFFTQKKNFEATVIAFTDKEQTGFQRIGFSRKYRPIQDVFIWIEANKYNQDDIDYMFYGDAGKFTYFEKGVEKEYKGTNLYKECIVEEEGNTFVYNRIYDYWIKKEDAIYDENLHSYIEK